MSSKTYSFRLNETDDADLIKLLDNVDSSKRSFLIRALLRDGKDSTQRVYTQTTPNGTAVSITGVYKSVNMPTYPDDVIYAPVED